jgi:hypothetical protein
MTQAHQIGPGQVGNQIIQVIPCGGRESHNSDTPLVVGAFSFNPNNYSLAKATVVFKLVVIAANGTTPLTTHIKLRNITDSEDVTSSVINIVDSTSQVKYEATLVVGAGAGTIKNTGEKIYECRIYLDVPPGNPATDTIELYKAEVQAIFTVL